LKEIGDWLRLNGESIYGTRGGPFLPGTYGVSTNRGQKIYVHVLDWKGADKLLLPAIPAKVVHAALLAGGEATVSQTEQGIEITVPAGSRNDTDTIVVLELDQPADRIKPVAPIGN